MKTRKSMYIQYGPTVGNLYLNEDEATLKEIERNAKWACSYSKAHYFDDESEAIETYNKHLNK